MSSAIIDESFAVHSFDLYSASCTVENASPAFRFQIQQRWTAPTGKSVDKVVRDAQKKARKKNGDESDHGQGEQLGADNEEDLSPSAAGGADEED
ncbi:unnamed protein product, partial [Amoebophrya sp. A25]|eukprot:GSA25T00013000001.1